MRQFRDCVGLLPVPARRLLCLIAQQASHGSLRSKEPGIATMPELHEACGLEVDEMYSLLLVLKNAQLISIDGSYPFEEVGFAGWNPMEALQKQCDAAKIPIQNVVVDLRFDLVMVGE